MLIGKRKEDVEVEEVKEGRVAAEDYCRWGVRVDRGQCARRGVHTIRCLDLARRRVDEAAKHGVGSRRAPSRRRCCPSVLFNTSHLSIPHYPLFTFTKSAMARRSNNIRTSLSLLSATPRFSTLFHTIHPSIPHSHYPLFTFY